MRGHLWLNKVASELGPLMCPPQQPQEEKKNSKVRKADARTKAFEKLAKSVVCIYLISKLLTTSTEKKMESF